MLLQRRDEIGRGVARLGVAWLGGQGKARRGMARLGGHGGAWLGEAGHGAAVKIKQSKAPASFLTGA